ncbi:MAG: class I SAM-dependent methyltransferase [Dehalococcoidia bacterium]|nr:class I SAM-dependent methyltransferase [Dehalococcoidia bacterium]
MSLDLGLPLHRESEFTLASTEWCPHPERYSAYDTDAAEVEALEVLAALVRALKPAFVLETGTHLGRSAAYIADALDRNRYGCMVSLEINSDYAAAARDLLAWHGLLGLGIGQCDVLQVSSFEYIPPLPIDFLFSDSELGTRRHELERLRPWLAPRAWVAVHDTLTHLSVIGDLAPLGWIERVDIPTPRGLTIGRVRNENS